MGQAKLRGTKEQRITAAQERNAEALAARKVLEAEKAARKAEAIARLPPEEQEQYRERVHQRRMATANMVGLMLAMTLEGKFSDP